MALKLDMNKPYDMVEWTFIKDVTQKMGFKDAWVDLIMRCVSSVSYSINIMVEGDALLNEVEDCTK